MYRLAAALIVIAITLVVAVRADAFPGANGVIVYGWSSLDEPELGPPFHADRSIRSVAPRGGTPTTLRGCAQTTGQPDTGDCALPVYADPAVSRNGLRVAFDAGSSLAVMDIDGDRFRLFPAHSADDGEPAFSPSGPSLVFSVVGSDNARDLWLSDSLGAGAHRLIENGSVPVWSTRNWVAFLRRDGVYRVRPDGYGLRRLAARGRCTDVAWSPHGTKVAFACRGRLIVANADGGAPRRVAGVSGAVDVAWSPDGRRFVLHEFDSGVRTIRTDGSHSRQLVRGGVNATSSFDANGVAWQPLR